MIFSGDEAQLPANTYENTNIPNWNRWNVQSVCLTKINYYSDAEVLHAYALVSDVSIAANSEICISLDE